MSARPLTLFWRSFDANPGGAAVGDHWRHVLGDDSVWAAPLLRATDRVAGRYPRFAPGPPGHEDAYELVWQDEDADRYRLSLPTDDGGGDVIELRREQLVVHALDLPGLCDGVAGAMGLTPAFAAVNGAPDAHRVGAYEPPAGQPVRAYLCNPGGPRRLSEAVAALAAMQSGQILVLTPTQVNRHALPETLRGRVAVESLDRLLAGGAPGQFVATADTGAVFEPLVRPSVPHTPTTVPPPDEPVLRRDGAMWTLAYGGLTRHAPAKYKGLDYIAHLLAHPGESRHAVELVATVACRPELAALGGRRAEAVVDGPGWQRLRREAAELQEALARARDANDLAAQCHLQAELAKLATAVDAAQGKGGRDRALDNPAERARKAVCNAVARAMDAIREAHEPLWRHLDASIETGAFLRYRPPPGPAGRRA